MIRPLKAHGPFLVALGLVLLLVTGGDGPRGESAGDETRVAASVLPGLGFTPRRQIPEEERRKREMFLRARERMVDPSPAPTPQATPRSTPRATPTPRPRATPTPAPARRAEPEPRATPEPTAEPRPTATPRVRATPTPRPRATPRPTPRPTPTPRPRREAPAAPVTIQKSGEGEDQGFEPPPPRERRGWFSRGPTYKYLTPEVRDAIDRAKVQRGRWKYIIIHNSATRQGNAAIFANYHRNVRKMRNGLAYHFVIGNGTKSGNGEIEIGDRWYRQINGGHVASDYLNNIAIGICFVGDFDSHNPTQEQIEALNELLAYLRRRVGRIEGRPSIVTTHKQINPRPTSCPGRRFPYQWLARQFK